MSPRTLPLLRKVPIPKGTPEFEAKVDAILQEFAESIPQDLTLTQDALDGAPRNVTGVPRECGLLSARELEITEVLDAYALADAIASKRYTAVEVATAFCKRAVIAHQLTSCLTEWFMHEAVDQARALDAHLESTGQTVGPLHGVPVSIKLHMPVAGHWSNVGYLSTSVRDTHDCQMVAILRKAGAVFYCKTNQPQSIMQLESVSYYGRVLNPHNTDLSAGGSTGGESALVALRGSVLGVGTDIGGSVRGPSAFCGIYGFKPTLFVLPTKDFVAGGYSSELNIRTSTGPMCSSLRDLDWFMSIVLSAKPHLEDPSLVPVRWTGLGQQTQQQNGSQLLKVGFIMNDGVITPQPPVTKALEWARSQLAQMPGVQVKDFKPYEVAQAIKNIRVSYWPDGGNGTRNCLAASGEPLLPLTEWIIRDATANGECSLKGVLEQRRTRDAFRCKFAEHWTSQDVDVVICPAFVGPACAHETAWYWNYTAFWNYVDYPGVVVPTPIVAGKKGQDEYVSDVALSDDCRHVRQLWAETDFEGAPINLQIVARRHHDVELFEALDVLKEALQIR